MQAFLLRIVWVDLWSCWGVLDLEQGSVHSYICPSLDKYSAFGAHATSIVGLLATAEGILSVSSNCVRMHTKGGVPFLTFRLVCNCQSLLYTAYWVVFALIDVLKLKSALHIVRFHYLVSMGMTSSSANDYLLVEVCLKPICINPSSKGSSTGPEQVLWCRRWVFI